MDADLLFRSFKCMQTKPFDIRRERRQFRRYCKQHGVIQAKQELRYFRTERKHFKYMTDGMETF
ncbi:hypothetical protein PP761_gp03 [Stenotrophomonas phage Paxi]|uniref:Uncharacterized protein n=1 Tax=Stenotrophomonas phage Paxi TaxID=2859653 RepID=A0AAE7WLP8_9CAUD|nr:hypothetical protein PP761_gp03 [Stenotrophomonas phage Paxi]QYW01774.1 hypothetical protein CPT_Paxi_003 [Stenotrophomonas phage Paxi]